MRIFLVSFITSDALIYKGLIYRNNFFKSTQRKNRLFPKLQGSTEIVFLVMKIFQIQRFLQSLSGSGRLRNQTGQAQALAGSTGSGTGTNRLAQESILASVLAKTQQVSGTCRSLKDACLSRI